MFGFLTQFTMASTSWSLQRSPDAAVIAELQNADVAEASTALRSFLLQNYQPGQALSLGSSGRLEFQAWLDLARWVELLATPDLEAAEPFFRRFVFQDAADPQRLVLRPVGVSITNELAPASAEKVRELLQDPNSVSRLKSDFLLPDFEFKDGSLLDYLGRDLAWQLAADPAFLKTFWSFVSNADFLPAVFENLARLHKHNAASFDGYRGLSLALAVVFDQKTPPNWPHHQVPDSKVPFADSTVEERLDYWVGVNESTRLANDLRTLGPDYLRFIVDTLVTKDELEWARRNVRHPVSDFGRAFSEIKYSRERLAAGEFTWPHSEDYQLAAIRQHGGICVDQAYFAMLAGKAHGLPTLYFVGQGADGGHAWFGYMRGANRWDMDVGRYENQNYAVGHALDPQSWEQISDQELNFLAARFRSTPEFAAGQADLVVSEWFQDAGEWESAKLAAASSISATKVNPEAWEAMTTILIAMKAPAKEVDQHLETATKEFSGQRELLAKFSTQRADYARAQGDAGAADSIEQTLISRTSGDRADLALETVKKRLDALVAENDLRNAMREYQSQAARLGRSAGGNFFYDVTRPFTLALISKGETRDAVRAIEIARRYLRPDRGSILDQELAELEGLTKR